MDFKKIRNEFPMLKNDLIYLDSAALVQKPKKVIEAINDFYTKYAISNRSNDSKLGIIVNQKINDTRQAVAQLINCDLNEVIFNSGTTEGLNYLALLLAQLVSTQDEIIISQYNHSSHMIPWIELAKRKNAKVIFSDNLVKDISPRTKIIAFTQANNNLQKNSDFNELIKLVRKYNIILVNDAAQAISHQKVDAKYFDAITFSANKLFGPTGLGVLYVSQKILKQVAAQKYGGGAIESIDHKGNWKLVNSISQHEPGTLNLAAIFGFHQALLFFSQIDYKKMDKYLNELSTYAHQKLSKIANLTLFSQPGDTIILFECNDMSAQDVVSYLGHQNIYVRGGWFCAQYIKNIFKNPLVRVSLHIYNNQKDIDTLCQYLEKRGDFLDFL